MKTNFLQLKSKMNRRPLPDLKLCPSPEFLSSGNIFNNEDSAFFDFLRFHQKKKVLSRDRIVERPLGRIAAPIEPTFEPRFPAKIFLAGKSSRSSPRKVTKRTRIHSSLVFSADWSFKPVQKKNFKTIIICKKTLKVLQ
jgi:hypothetical protein